MSTVGIGPLIPPSQSAQRQPVASHQPRNLPPKKDSCCQSCCTRIQNIFYCCSKTSSAPNSAPKETSKQKAERYLQQFSKHLEEENSFLQRTRPPEEEACCISFFRVICCRSRKASLSQEEYNKQARDLRKNKLQAFENAKKAIQKLPQSEKDALEKELRQLQVLSPEIQDVRTKAFQTNARKATRLLNQMDDPANQILALHQNLLNYHHEINGRVQNLLQAMKARKQASLPLYNSAIDGATDEIASLNAELSSLRASLQEALAQDKIASLNAELSSLRASLQEALAKAPASVPSAPFDFSEKARRVLETGSLALEIGLILTALANVLEQVRIEGSIVIIPEAGRTLTKMALDMLPIHITCVYSIIRTWFDRRNFLPELGILSLAAENRYLSLSSLSWYVTTLAGIFHLVYSSPHLKEQAFNYVKNNKINSAIAASLFGTLYYNFNLSLKITPIAIAAILYLNNQVFNHINSNKVPYAMVAIATGGAVAKSYFNQEEGDHSTSTSEWSSLTSLTAGLATQVLPSAGELLSSFASGAQAIAEEYPAAAATTAGLSALYLVHKTVGIKKVLSGVSYVANKIGLRGMGISASALAFAGGLVSAPLATGAIAAFTGSKIYDWLNPPQTAS